MMQKRINYYLLTNRNMLESLSSGIDVSVDDIEKYLISVTQEKETGSDDSIQNRKSSNNETVIFIDGGSRGNPGESGIGIVIENDNRRKGYYFYTGIMTNNQAEYTGLLKALEISTKNEYKNIKIYSDSQLLCHQINGIYKVSNSQLRNLHLEATNMIRAFENFSIEHIRREKNRDADRLANLAMDKKKNNEVELTVAVE